MLRRRRRDDSELIDLVRAELATMRDELHAGLAETTAGLTARMRSELDHRMGEPSALAAGMHEVRETIALRDSELATVLNQVVVTCEHLGQRMQIDRIERAALVDAVSRLSGVLAAAAALPLTAPPIPTSAPEPPPAPPPSRATVIGGTVDPARAPEPATEAVPARTEAFTPAPTPAPEPVPREIDLEAEARAPEHPIPPPAHPVRPDGVEVRCRFGDRWVTGFEVCEVIRVDDVTRYRLRRRSDGAVIPTLFDEKDLRFFSTTFVET